MPQGWSRRARLAGGAVLVVASFWAFVPVVQLGERGGAEEAVPVIVQVVLEEVGAAPEHGCAPQTGQRSAEVPGGLLQPRGGHEHVDLHDSVAESDADQRHRDEQLDEGEASLWVAPLHEG